MVLSKHESVTDINIVNCSYRIYDDKQLYEVRQFAAI